MRSPASSSTSWRHSPRPGSGRGRRAPEHMAEAPGLVVVANPSAGRGKAGRLIGKVTTGLHRLGVDHEVRVSESGPDLERIARTAAHDGATIVAAPGGDGAISLAAHGILRSGAALAALPA